MRWPERARLAAVALSNGEERQSNSLTEMLLRDIHAFWASCSHDRAATAEVLEYLHGVEESPWGDWYGKQLSAHKLSKLLRPYRIRTMSVKVDGKAVRGYKVEQFADAFARALSVTGVTSVTPESASQKGGNAGNAGNAYTRNGKPSQMELVVIAEAQALVDAGQARWVE
jgi:hypothetical protein